MNRAHSADLLNDHSRFSSFSGLFFLGLMFFTLYQPGWIESGLDVVQACLAPLAEALERFTQSLR